MIEQLKLKFNLNDTQLENEKKKMISMVKNFVISLFRWIVIIGICYVILGPIIGIVTSSFFSNADAYNPMV